MKKTFKKILASVVALATLTCGMFSTTLISYAAEINEDMMIAGINSESDASFNYVLNTANTQYFQLSISAPTNSAAIFTYNTVPSKGNVTMYVKSSNSASASAVYTRVFDSSGHAPALSFSINAGTTYYIYLEGSKNNTSGHMNGTKVVA